MADAVQGISSNIQALIHEYETVTQNLANMSTTGYKRNMNSFTRELMGRLSDDPQHIPPDGSIAILPGRDFSQGQLTMTSRHLDVAIRGKGFFVIETPEGPLYTRSGVLQVQRDGRVVDVNGRNVAGMEGPIILPSTISELDISISENGTLKSGDTVLGQLKIVDFGANENRLVADGYNCFRAPQDAIPMAADKASVQQGYRESSNVKAVEEMVNLMKVSRMYETNMNLLRKRQDYTRAILTVANG